MAVLFSRVNAEEDLVSLILPEHSKVLFKYCANAQWFLEEKDGI